MYGEPDSAFIDVECALLRLAQIEHRITEKHPRAAEDPVLASLLESLRDALTVED